MGRTRRWGACASSSSQRRLRLEAVTTPSSTNSTNLYLRKTLAAGSGACAPSSSKRSRLKMATPPSSAASTQYRFRKTIQLFRAGLPTKSAGAPARKLPVDVIVKRRRGGGATYVRASHRAAQHRLQYRGLKIRYISTLSVVVVAPYFCCGGLCSEPTTQRGA